MRTAKEIAEIIFKDTHESNVIDRYDNEILEWLDDDWEDEYDDEFEAYIECGNGEAEDVIINELIQWYETHHNQKEKLPVELMLQVRELIKEHYDCLSKAG